MSNDLIDEIKEVKKYHEVTQVAFFNDKKVRTDEYWLSKDMKFTDNRHSYQRIQDSLLGCAKSLVYQCDFDEVEMKLSLGLIFDKKDVNDKNKIAADAEPVENYVRFYTTEANGYLNGKKTNTRDAGYLNSTQGYINYDFLVEAAEKNGIEFNGPENFEEFEEKILMGKPFDINLRVSLLEKESNKHNQNVRVK